MAVTSLPPPSDSRSRSRLTSRGKVAAYILAANPWPNIYPAAVPDDDPEFIQDQH